MKGNNKPIEEQTLVERLRIRASIRRNNTERKSVQEGKPDRISDLLEEAADEIERKDNIINGLLEHIEMLKGGMTQQIEVLDALPGSGKSYAILKYISEHKDFACNSNYTML